MQFVKLQVGCLFVILYIEITYIRAAFKGKITCNRQFDALMIVAPWAVFFDGFTAWTVNHMDLILANVNRLAHLFFLLCMDLTIIITFAYMYDQQISLPEERKNARNLVLYSDCRRDSGDTDLFSGSIVDIHFSNDIAAWNLYWI